MSPEAPPVKRWLAKLLLLTVALGTGYFFSSLIGLELTWREPSDPLYRGPGFARAAGIMFLAIGIGLLVSAHDPEKSLLFDLLRSSPGWRELGPHLGSLFQLLAFAALSLAGFMFAMASETPV